jgi:hypothetical protein
MPGKNRRSLRYRPSCADRPSRGKKHGKDCGSVRNPGKAADLRQKKKGKKTP